MDRLDFLEMSLFQADEGELIGKDRHAFGNSLPEIQGAESPEGTSGDLSRLLLWERRRGSQMCGG
jgi:hypothetical protein